MPRDGGNRFQMQRNLDRAGLGHLVPACWRNKPTGTTDVFGRLWWDRPAFTIRTEFYKPEKGRYLHPSEDRPITIREAARCMSFPDDFVLPADQTMTEIAKQIGNAVPPPLATALAVALAARARPGGRAGVRAGGLGFGSRFAARLPTAPDAATILRHHRPGRGAGLFRFAP